jgi:4-hydroxybutyrate CoA-transferase
MSKGGKRIHALASIYTDKDGNLKSKILPTLPEGSIVTTSRNELEYIVTEYGVVDISFDSFSVRTKKLISIAHPHSLSNHLKKPLQKCYLVSIWRIA